MDLHQQVLQHRDTSYLDNLLLDKQGRLKVVPSSTHQSIPWEDIRLWCHLHAVYGLPTTELVEYLGQLIDGRKAIEVGAGNGTLGRALDIPRTDSFIQLRPDVALFYLAQGQPLVEYGDDVECLDAIAAIKKHRPQVVIGSWVTQTSDGSRPGCMFGLDEEEILRQVETYVVFGSLRNHGGEKKVINQHDHKVIQEPWMRSRAPDSALFIWGG